MLKVIVCFWFLIPCSFAGDFLQVGETKFRTSLEYLNDTGAASFSLTTWPIDILSLKNNVSNIDAELLSSAQMIALDNIKLYLNKSEKKYLQTINLSIRDKEKLSRNFSDHVGNEEGLSYTVNINNSFFSTLIQANISNDPVQNSYLDGSYIVTNGSPLRVGFGSLDRWWGPSQISSLILSNNARPITSFFFQANGEYISSYRWLSWLKNWSFVSFIGELENDRVIPNARITGLRFTFKPSQSLEFGLSRAMQWGGQGRSNDIKTFFRSLTTQGENNERSAGNQLGGFDLRYSYNNFSVNSSVYLQIIGEDEAGYLPSKYMLQLGNTWLFEIGNHGSYLKGYLEYTNTTAGALGDNHYGSAYEHSTYRSGYRYYGRAIGAVYDNDAEVFTFGLNLNSFSQWTIISYISSISLNKDGQGQNSLVSTAEDLYLLSTKWQGIALNGRLHMGLDWLSRSINEQTQRWGRVGFTVEWEFTL